MIFLAFLEHLDLGPMVAGGGNVCVCVCVFTGF